jgi:hypothetical protein
MAKSPKAKGHFRAGPKSRATGSGPSRARRGGLSRTPPRHFPVLGSGTAGTRRIYRPAAPGGRHVPHRWTAEPICRTAQSPGSASDTEQTLTQQPVNVLPLGHANDRYAVRPKRTSAVGKPRSRAGLEQQASGAEGAVLRDGGQALAAMARHCSAQARQARAQARHSAPQSKRSHSVAQASQMTLWGDVSAGNSGGAARGGQRGILVNVPGPPAVELDTANAIDSGCGLRDAACIGGQVGQREEAIAPGLGQLPA